MIWIPDKKKPAIQMFFRCYSVFVQNNTFSRWQVKSGEKFANLKKIRKLIKFLRWKLKLMNFVGLLKESNFVSNNTVGIWLPAIQLPDFLSAIQVAIQLPDKKSVNWMV